MMIEADKLYRQYRAKLMAFVCRRVDNKQAAEDILQEIFIKLLTKGADIRHADHLRGWLYRVARNAIIDYRRAGRRLEPLPDDLVAEATDSPAACELVECLNPLIAALPANYREAIRLSEIQQLPLKEVARRLHISLSGAKSRIQRGRRKLKAIILDCCQIEVTPRGDLVGYEAKPKCC